jgi:hypothetical protein
LPAVVVKIGPQAGRRVELGVKVVIGREDADLMLDDPEVSRRHAVLRRSGDSVVIEDLDSTNGTFVNGERIREPITVRCGDEVRLGRTTLEIEPDHRADDTVMSIPLRPDRIPSTGVRAVADPVSEQTSHDLGREAEESTQPLPFRMPEARLRPAHSNSWFAIGAVVLAAILGVVAYAELSDPPRQSDFTARVNDACDAVQRSGGGVDLSSNPTRGELERARNIRLQALGAIRAIGGPEGGAVPVSGFLSAFGETNTSITRLEAVIGSRQGKVGRALRSLREDVKVERKLAAQAGIPGCGGLAIR